MLVLSTVVGVAACGGVAPGEGRTAAYRTDYAACDGTVTDAVDARNAKTGLAWFASPVRRWGQIGDGVSACMQDKGWGRTRACTEAELQSGSRAPNKVVTSAGVRCTDPATRG